MRLGDQAFNARMAMEAAEIRKDFPNFKPINGNIMKWRGKIIGSGIYRGGVFCLEISVTRDFPYKPPMARVVNKIYHPNINDRRVCVGILGKQWLPGHTLTDVIQSVVFLLSNPNPDDPLDYRCASLYKSDLKKFTEVAKEYVIQYASGNSPCEELL